MQVQQMPVLIQFSLSFFLGAFHRKLPFTHIRDSASKAEICDPFHNLKFRHLS